MNTACRAAMQGRAGLLAPVLTMLGLLLAGPAVSQDQAMSAAGMTAAQGQAMAQGTPADAVPMAGSATAAPVTSPAPAPAPASAAADATATFPVQADVPVSRLRATQPLRIRGRRMPGAGGGVVQSAGTSAPVRPAVEADPAVLALGQRIYQEGIGAEGRPVQAERAGLALGGQEVACVRCHRASGMGSVEGEVRISPISGRYLVPVEGDVTMSVMDGHVGKAINLRHPPYNSDSLGRALSAGLSVDNRQLSNVMPHFQLSAAEVEALQAYLSQLSVAYSPGAEAKVIRLATVITPDVSSERRVLFRTMMETALRGKNASTAPQHRYMASAAAFVTRSDRKWALEFWELTGAPETWAAQLDARYAANTPFALLSGLSGGQSWQPVHAFCNRHAVPCWFPSVSVPGEDAASGYNLYFSGGVRLEARVLANTLTAQPLPKGGRLIQVRAAGAAATQAADLLRDSLQAQPGQWSLQTRELTGTDQAALDRALQGVSSKDRVVLWHEGPLPPQWTWRLRQPVYLSATLLGDGGIRSLPGNWRPQSRVVYPYELPQKREANLAYLQTWLKQYDIPMRDEVLQSEVFFATNFFTDVVTDMLDNLYRDYLVERAEDMLGRRETGKAEQETRDRVTLTRNARHVVNSTAALNMKAADAPDAQTAARVVFGFKESQGTTVYPHLNLGPRQRFASKGAYIVRVGEGASAALSVDQDWIIP